MLQVRELNTTNQLLFRDTIISSLTAALLQKLNEASDISTTRFVAPTVALYVYTLNFLIDEVVSLARQEWLRLTECIVILNVLKNAFASSTSAIHVTASRVCTMSCKKLLNEQTSAIVAMDTSLQNKLKSVQDAI